MLRFTDQVVMITGAGRGIGRAYALGLAARGATVIAVDLGCDMSGKGQDGSYIEDVVDLIKDMGGQAVGHCLDVRDRRNLDWLVSDTLERFGRIDGLICNAGTLLVQQGAGQNSDDHRLMMEMNHFSTVEAIQAVWPQMQLQRHGRILVTSASSSLYGDSRLVGYSASNLANVGLVNSLALESEEYGIRVNAICPACSTRLIQALDVPVNAEELTPDLIVPPMLWLMSDSAPNGEIVLAGGGHYSLARFQETEGIFLPLSQQRPERFAQEWGRLKEMPKSRPFVNYNERLQSIIKMLKLERR
ncbi:SDR family NAD(P)-dependent oxidoreductase [Ferrimonas marina]|uniref:NAD(P)-dependent dehydrogenase, short-chain alcohol dehydrogenase family n=1 Tax=Ferrimonas marina TaxID=299255 RepID=A0A1M5VN36_9GAMM|nr:SDR family NAD(P)-dependent oxidoreductase [Ferrimonas marina]SHH76454.1 NAD(P)-dependent dehydrogenase, short-chain alcohol dehydrogenase family [Ferrimonas marina]